MQPEAEHTFCVWIHLLDESAVNGYSFFKILWYHKVSRHVSTVGYIVQTLHNLSGFCP